MAKLVVVLGLQLIYSAEGRQRLRHGKNKYPTKYLEFVKNENIFDKLFHQLQSERDKQAKSQITLELKLRCSKEVQNHTQVQQDVAKDCAHQMAVKNCQPQMKQFIKQLEEATMRQYKLGLIKRQIDLTDENSSKFFFKFKTYLESHYTVNMGDSKMVAGLVTTTLSNFFQKLNKKLIVSMLIEDYTELVAAQKEIEKLKRFNQSKVRQLRTQKKKNIDLKSINETLKKEKAEYRKSTSDQEISQKGKKVQEIIVDGLSTRASDIHQKNVSDNKGLKFKTELQDQFLNFLLYWALFFATSVWKLQGPCKSVINLVGLTLIWYSVAAIKYGGCSFLECCCPNQDSKRKVTAQVWQNDDLYSMVNPISKCGMRMGCHWCLWVKQEDHLSILCTVIIVGLQEYYGGSLDDIHQQQGNTDTQYKDGLQGGAKFFAIFVMLCKKNTSSFSFCQCCPLGIEKQCSNDTELESKLIGLTQKQHLQDKYQKEDVTFQTIIDQLSDDTKEKLSQIKFNINNLKDDYEELKELKKAFEHQKEQTPEKQQIIEQMIAQLDKKLDALNQSGQTQRQSQIFQPGLRFHLDQKKDLYSSSDEEASDEEASGDDNVYLSRDECDEEFGVVKTEI